MGSSEALYNLEKNLSKIRQLSPDMPVSQVLCLLTVARKSPEGLSISDLAKSLGLSLPTASRYVAELGKHGIRNKDGLQLLAARENPLERRQKLVVLTDKGEKLLRSLG